MSVMKAGAHNLINALLFQLVWFGAVVGAARGTMTWAAVALAMLAAHVSYLGNGKRDFALAVICAAIGGCLDSLWIAAGILDLGTQIAPPWILALWMAVGLSLNHSLSWFGRYPLLGGVFAGVAAPLSYSGGAALGAASVLEPLGLGVVGAVWLMLFWGLFSISGDDRSRQLEVET